MQATGYAGSAVTVPAPRDATMNERLNRLSEGLQHNCERIELVLARVNGGGQNSNKAPSAVAQINPTLPMATALEHLEAIGVRLSDLASGIERIA